MELQRRIAAWPGVFVLQGTERGDRFCAARGEFVHFHGDRQMDARLSPEERDRAIAEHRASFHPRAHEGGWVIVKLRDEAFRDALRLAAAAYRHRTGRRTNLKT